MMKKSAVLKFITLVIFTSLLAVFVFYQSGYFNHRYKSKPQLPAKDMLVKKIVDSIIHKKDSQEQLWLPSSKSIVISKLSPEDSLIIQHLKDSIEKELQQIESSKTKQ
jgi:hypothetical protein